MKYKISIIFLTLALLLGLSACGSQSVQADNSTVLVEPTGDTETVTGGEELESDSAETENAESTVDTDTQEDASADSEAEGSTDTAAALMDEWPTDEEIQAVLDAGEAKLYWCAETPTHSDTMQLYSVTEPDIEDFASQLAAQLGDGYTANVSGNTLAFELVPNGTDGTDIEAILAAMTQLSGMDYASVESLDVREGACAAEYVPELDGYCVDCEGSSSEDDLVGITYVSLYDDGDVRICRPLILSGEAESLDTAQLVSPEAVKTICQSWYENTGLSAAYIFTDLTLEYYYSPVEGKLLPAWLCTFTFYIGSSTHTDSAMLDAQTGEMLRK